MLRKDSSLTASRKIGITKQKNFMLMAALVGIGTSLAGCAKENSNDTAIAAGLACLDTATTTAQADSCQATVAGITTSQAYMIRCSANLIAQGLTGTRIANAYQQMKSSSSGTNTATAMLAYLVFNPTLVNDTAAITNANCSASGDTSLSGIGNLINTASVVANFYAASTGSSLAGSSLDPSSASFNPAQLASAVSAAYSADDPTVNAAVGQAAISAASTYCGTGGALASQSVCTQISAAVNKGGSASDTGYSLLLSLSKLTP